MDASPAKGRGFPSAIEASPAVSRSSGRVKKFFRIIQHNRKESIHWRK
jgi:hypothetical protein